MVKCHHPKSSGYCSTLHGKPSYTFRHMLDRSTCCFGSSAQGVFVSAQMIHCFMQTLFQVVLSPSEVLAQRKMGRLMLELVELMR